MNHALLSDSHTRPDAAGGDLPPAIQERIPQQDRWALDPAARQQRILSEMERRLRLSRFLLEPERHAERERFMQQCREDPAFFLRHVIWTKDPERNMSEMVEVPLIPFTYAVEPIPWRDAGGWLRRWTEALNRHEPGRKVRFLEEKTRRTLLSITSAAFFLWGMRFFPGFHAWMSSDQEEAIDHGEDWDSWFAKLRYMWQKANEFYPWLFPALPAVGTTSANKDRYIEFPRWVVGNKEVAPECWGNKVRGLTPNEVSGRGGASLLGFIDEAGWIDNLDAFLDNIEQMTPLLILASTPPADASHPFARRAQGEFGYKVSFVHWTMNPVMVHGIYWDESGDVRGPYTEKWRSVFYNEVLATQPSHVVARNYDLDYRSVAGDRVFVSFRPAPRATAEENTDLWDPRWPLEIWYDVGRRDPWACLWVQVSDATGEVRIVDYWMRAGVTVEWWLPIWLGWNPEQKDRWRTHPDLRPWKHSVPWPYGPEDLALMKKWFLRFGARPDVGSEVPWNTRRPRRFVQDAFGRQHNAASLTSVEDVMFQYGLQVVSSSTAHNLEHWIEHANSVLTRTTISPHLRDLRPQSGGVRYPSLYDSFLSWSWLPATPREGAPKPAHDIHSHVGTCFVYGAMQLPLKGLPAPTDPKEADPKPRRRLYSVTSGRPQWDGRW